MRSGDHFGFMQNTRVHATRSTFLTTQASYSLQFYHSSPIFSVETLLQSD